MSRIGKKPVEMPAGVTATLNGSHLTVKGPKGTLERTLPAEMVLAVEGNVITVTRPSEEPRHKALHGLTRTLVANMVEGVSKGYVKALELHGVGYKAEAKGNGVNLVVGLSHQVLVPAPAGIAFKLETPTLLKIEGIDKELVGQVAAEIRNVRPPEPYKGKGIRYQGEQIRRKAGKTGAK
ncbi:MAG TPA: 50S ribosomal protein L6 [Alphaproteobacteria bacterium]|nr:50S ribosomal protein L6 [Alphaproteobacteria bacterium]